MKGGASDPTGVQVERRLSMLQDAHAKKKTVQSWRLMDMFNYLLHVIC